MRHLFYRDVAPGSAYHAALVAAEGAGARGWQVTEHTHDFYELMYVLAGEAAHAVNGVSVPLRSGSLVLLRAERDRHAVRFVEGRPLHYMNIALPAERWRAFRDLAGVGDLLEGTPSPVLLDGARAEACAGEFRRALERFQYAAPAAPALGLDLCRLLAAVVPLLGGAPAEDSGGDLPADAPPWLARACRTLRRDPNALREGLPWFVAAAGVTRTHLARVLKAATGLTPTAYVNRLRLERAALLLTTTTLPILDIAGECGFEQPSYFYRLFAARYGAAPHAYRLAARRSVAPGAR
jgi:AraC family cel operon transcriptional repressor